MELKFGYGNREEIVNVPEKNLLGVLTANEMAHVHLGEEAVRYALANPIGAAPLRETVKPGQKIAIVASDISRPVPSWQLLPAILEELFAAGCKAEDVTVVFALGSHRNHTEASAGTCARYTVPPTCSIGMVSMVIPEYRTFKPSQY